MRRDFRLRRHGVARIGIFVQEARRDIDREVQGISFRTAPLDEDHAFLPLTPAG
jgi:hypothetical protein